MNHNDDYYKKQLQKGFFSTNDLALSTSLLAMGFVLCDVDYSDPRKVVFMFVEDQEVRDAVSDYWANKLRVNPRTYFNTLKDLKSRIYNEKYAN